MAMRSDLGPVRPPVASLRYRFNIDRILHEVTEELEKASGEAIEFERRTKIPQRIYCTLQVPIPITDRTVLGNFPTRICELSPEYVDTFVTRSQQNSFLVYKFGLKTNPLKSEELISTLSLLFDHENLNYLPSIGLAAGKRDESSGIESEMWRKNYTPEKFVPPYQDPSEFQNYYAMIAYRMYVEDLYANTNIAVSRISDDLVWVMRTIRKGSIRENIRIENEDYIARLADMNCFEFYLENHRIPSQPTNPYDRGTFPNIVFDFDLKSKKMEKELPRVLVAFQDDFEKEGLKYVFKLTGQSGVNIHLYMSNFKAPNSSRYIPLKIFRRRMEMSAVQMRNEIERMRNDPFEVARDFIRMKVNFIKRKNSELRDILTHDYDLEFAWRPDRITVDSGSVKFRSYHRAFFSLTKSKTVCIPLCSTGETLTERLFEEKSNLSKNPQQVLDDESITIPKIERNDFGKIKSFLEEYCSRLYPNEFKYCQDKLKRTRQISPA